jgi:hypothetical protein
LNVVSPTEIAWGPSLRDGTPKVRLRASLATILRSFQLLFTVSWLVRWRVVATRWSIASTTWCRGGKRDTISTSHDVNGLVFVLRAFKRFSEVVLELKDLVSYVRRREDEGGLLQYQKYVGMSIANTLSSTSVLMAAKVE